METTNPDELSRDLSPNQNSSVAKSGQAARSDSPHPTAAPIVPIENLFDAGALPPPDWFVRNEDGEFPDEPPVDFISAYADYADVLEAPRETHEWVARQLIATTLNRNGVVIRHGALSHPLDLWVLILSESGFGRSTLIGFTEPVLTKAELEGLEQNAHWGSRQAVYQQTADNPAALWTWGEMSEILKLLNQPQFSGVKEWITDRYDNRRIPAPITYRHTGKSKDTPPIRFSDAPRINILATSSEAWFFPNLVQEDSTGGFIARWVLDRVTDLRRVIPTPEKTDPEMAERLAGRLRQISELKGEADLSDILNDHDKWYREAWQRFESQPNSGLAMAYFNRHRVHILKLAVINEVSSSNSLKVSKASWDRAVQTAKQLEETIFALLATGMSLTGYTLGQMGEKVASTGAKGLSRSEFTRAFQHMPKPQREDALGTLIQAGTVVGFSRYTSGRSATILVHKNLVAEYQKGHPGDQVITEWRKT